MTTAVRCFIGACLIGSVVVLFAAARPDLLFIPLFMTYLIVSLLTPGWPAPSYAATWHTSRADPTGVRVEQADRALRGAA